MKYLPSLKMQRQYYMKADGNFQDFPAYTERSSKKPTLVIIFFLVLILVIITAGGLYFLNEQNKQQPIVVSISPSPTIPVIPTASPSATPTPDRSSLQIAVLNGSGMAGAARGISAHLTKVGYTIKTIGNADGFAYRNVTVRIKKSKESYLPMLKKDLEEEGSVSSISASVDNTISVDAEVIVGR